MPAPRADEGGPTVPGWVIRYQLHRFDRTFAGARRELRARYGEAAAEQILARTRAEYAELLPLTPWFGLRGLVFNAILLLNAELVACYRAMKAAGKSAEDVVRLYYDLFEASHDAIPPAVRSLVRPVFFSRAFRFIGQLSADATRDHPGGWQLTFHEGDGERDDLSFSCTDCGVIKYYERHGATELSPYCSFFDYLQSRTFGLGMHNPESLGRGHSRCVEQWKRGRETPLPEKIAKLLAPAPAS